MLKFLKQVIGVFIFGFLLGIIASNLNGEVNLNESSISVVKSLRAGGNQPKDQNPAFVLQQPGQSSVRYNIIYMILGTLPSLCIS